MFTKYISKIISFKEIPKHKYENCETRKEANLKFEKSTYNYLDDIENELFAGDKIIGVYKLSNEQIRLCLYEWKQNNNSKQIVAYSLIIENQKDFESHEKFTINDDIILLKPI